VLTPLFAVKIAWKLFLLASLLGLFMSWRILVLTGDLLPGDRFGVGEVLSRIFPSMSMRNQWGKSLK